MKQLSVVAVLLVLLAGCTDNRVTGSGNLVNQSFDLAGFSKIEADSYAQIAVTRGEAVQVAVQVDDNLASLLDVSVVGSTLRIALKGGVYGRITLHAQVTMPELTGVKLNGGSRVEAALAGEDVDVNLNGGSEAVLTGSAGRVTIDANGGSSARLGDLAAGDVEVRANGGSDVTLRASGAVRGTANGGSTVKVRGSPASVDVKTDGGARVTKE